MPIAKYEIYQTSSGWVIEHGPESSRPYDLPEAAFEAAVISASLSLKNNNDVIVSLTHQSRTQTSPGQRGAAPPGSVKTAHP